MPSPSTLEPVPWPPRSVPIDLEGPARAFAHLRTSDMSQTTGRYRRVVHLLEQQPCSVLSVGAPVPVGFLDGIQRRAVLGRIGHRDVSLVWVAAGTVRHPTLLDEQARLALVCSQVDEPEARRLAPQVPVVALPEVTPWDLAAATEEWVDQTRRRLEELAISAAPAAHGEVVVVDGSLPAASDRDDLVGVVKTLRTDWLPDPDLIPFTEGWRSPALRLPAPRTTERSKVTAYVRLHTATPSHSYEHALVRVEVYDDSPISIDQAAALAFRHRGTPAQGDPRWRVHLQGMYWAETILKSRIPHALRVLP